MSNKRDDLLNSQGINLFLITSFFLSIFFVIIFVGTDIPVLSYDASVESTQYFYLVSTIAQSLAAIFALFLTASLIVTQLRSQYSHHTLKTFIDSYILLYIVLFIATIFLAFILLANPSLLLVIADRATWTKLLLLMSISCLVYLLPYLMSLRNKLTPESLINNYRRDAEKKLIEHSTEEPEEIKVIESITLKAHDLNDYEAFELGSEVLSKLSVTAAICLSRNPVTAPILPVQIKILDRIKNLFESTVNDLHYPQIISSTLGEAYILATTLNLSVRFNDGYYRLSEFCSIAIHANKENLSISICKQLSRIGITSIDTNNIQVIRVVIGFIVVIGLMANNARFKHLLKESIGSLIEIGSWSIYKIDHDEITDILIPRLKELHEFLNTMEGKRINIFELRPLTLLSYSTLDSKITDCFLRFREIYEGYEQV